MTAAALGAPVAALIQRCGIPDRVISDNRGNHFLLHESNGISDAIVDADRALVRAISVQGAGAAAEFANDASARTGDIMYAFGSVRVFAFGPDRAEVRSAENVTAGDLLALQRMRMLPGRIDGPGLGTAFTAPQPARANGDDGSGERATIVRIDIDATGIVRTVTTIVPSGDAAFDASLAARFGDDRYAPATLFGKPAGGSVYREIRH